MIYNFKTVDDDQQWVVDSEELNWARASSLVAAPTIKAAETNLARFVPTEEGKLIPMGGGRYALEGRKPFVGPDNHPQLAIIVILTLLSAENNGTCVTFMQANVAVKDLQHQQIKNFVAQCMPPLQLTPRSVGKMHVVKPVDPEMSGSAEVPAPSPTLPAAPEAQTQPEEKPLVTID